MKTYVMHEDPGHGWLGVKRKELQELGIEHRISSYSYQRGNTVYLEEDCDFSVFFNAYVAKYGCNPSYRTSVLDRRHQIRGYATFVTEGETK